MKVEKKEVVESFRPIEIRNELTFAEGFYVKRPDSEHKGRVFDYEKAFSLIQSRNPRIVIAGLAEDWKYTSGTVYKKGKFIDSDTAYLFSTWATPSIEMDGIGYECWKKVSQDDSSECKWPNQLKRRIK